MNEKTKSINGYDFISYHRPVFNELEMVSRSVAFYEWLNQRRSVRDFSSKPVPKRLIDNLIMSASTAPSGANCQPWTFCVVGNPEIKKVIRTEAEKEELENYSGRMPADWIEALKPLQTDWHKPFLESAPWLIVVFRKNYELTPEGEKRAHYYVHESVGLACGLLLAAIHNAGLVALTHTPSPMNFLSNILNRPENEKPFLLIPVGYPAEETYVPKLRRKTIEEVTAYY